MLYTKLHMEIVSVRLQWNQKNCHPLKDSEAISDDSRHGCSGAVHTVHNQEYLYCHLIPLHPRLCDVTNGCLLGR